MKSDLCLRSSNDISEARFNSRQMLLVKHIGSVRASKIMLPLSIHFCLEYPTEHAKSRLGFLLNCDLHLSKGIIFLYFEATICKVI